MTTLAALDLSILTEGLQRRLAAKNRAALDDLAAAVQSADVTARKQLTACARRPCPDTTRGRTQGRARRRRARSPRPTMNCA